MRLLLINPNTSESITSKVADAAAKAASPGTEIVSATAAFGARYVGSRAAAAIAGHAALDAYARHGEGADGVMLACFGDPGLLALREMAPVPVTGMAEASCHLACMLGRRFAIVTGGERWGPMLAEFVASIGLRDRLAGVRTVAPTGAEIAANPDGAYALLVDACDAAVTENGADIVILGGAGLIGVADKIADRVRAPLIDCMMASMGALEAAVRVKARKAEDGTFAKAPAAETEGLSRALKAAMEGHSRPQAKKV